MPKMKTEWLGAWNSFPPSNIETKSTHMYMFNITYEYLFQKFVLKSSGPILYLKQQFYSPHEIILDFNSFIL